MEDCRWEGSGPRLLPWKAAIQAANSGQSVSRIKVTSAGPTPLKPTRLLRVSELGDYLDKWFQALVE